MLKFQDNNTTVIATFEDFILTVYVFIDDLYHQFAPPEVTSRRNILDAKLSDSEIITISICGELAVCKFGRARYCRSFRGHGADYGKCPSKKETYFGYKVHAMITLEGYITTFEITPASTDDREGLKDIVEGQSGLVILGDKGYVGEALTREMSEQGICLMALKRSNSKADWPKSVRQLIFKLRRRVETVFSQLSEQLNAEKVLSKSFQGLCTRLVNKILGYNLCLVLNSIFDETCELGKIKQLIF